MTTELDKETRDVLAEGERWENFVSSPGWQEAKVRLLSKLAEFNSVSSIVLEARSLEDIGREVAMRNGAVEMVLQWLKDIEGQAQISKNNRESFTKQQEQQIMTRFD